MKIYEGTFNNVSGSILKAHLIPCYRRSDMKPGFYDLVGRSFHEFVGPGASIGPSITFGYGEIVNNIEAEAHPMLGTQYTETNKFTHTGNNMDDWRILSVYQRVEPGQQISISFDTDVTQWASGHGYSGINKGKWTMWIYFYKTYNINKGCDLPVCYAASQIKSLGGTRWKYSFTVPADMHMIKVRTNLYSDGSTSYTAHFWNFNWSFGDTGCQVNPLHAIPYNISTGDGRNGEKNGSFYGGGKGYIEFDGLPAESVKTVAFWVKSDKTNQCFYADPNSKTACGIFNNNFVIGCNKKNKTFPTTYFNSNEWNHIAIVCNSTPEVWINGLKQIPNELYNYWSQNGSDKAYLLTRYSGQFGPSSSGYIQDFQIWDEVKNPAELM